MEPFSKKVIDVVRKIPRGKVATYQQIAGLSGKPHASRGVAWILNSCAEKYKLPWQRVLSSKGRVSFKPLTAKHRLQTSLLKREGVRFAKNGDIEMSKFQWRKRPTLPRRRKNQPKMF